MVQGFYRLRHHLKLFHSQLTGTLSLGCVWVSLLFQSLWCFKSFEADRTDKHFSFESQRPMMFSSQWTECDCQILTWRLVWVFCLQILHFQCPVKGSLQNPSLSVQDRNSEQTIRVSVEHSFLSHFKKSCRSPSHRFSLWSHSAGRNVHPPNSPEVTIHADQQILPVEDTVLKI